MTDKRFINDIDNGKLIDTKGELSTIYYSDSVDFYELWEFLNKFNDENEQLKQFQDNVFSWIDMHLQRLPTLRDDEFESDNEFADPSLYSGAIQILETMKRELKR